MLNDPSVEADPLVFLTNAGAAFGARVLTSGAMPLPRVVRWPNQHPVLPRVPRACGPDTAWPTATTSC